MVADSKGEKLSELQWMTEKLHELLVRGERDRGELSTCGGGGGGAERTPVRDISHKSSRFGFLSLGREEESEEDLWDVLGNEEVECGGGAARAGARRRFGARACIGERRKGVGNERGTQGRGGAAAGAC